MEAPRKNGGGGNRTRVREPICLGVYVRSSRFKSLAVGRSANHPRPASRVRLAPQISSPWRAARPGDQPELATPGSSRLGQAGRRTDRVSYAARAKLSLAVIAFPGVLRGTEHLGTPPRLPVHASKPCRPRIVKQRRRSEPEARTDARRASTRSDLPRFHASPGQDPRRLAPL